MPLTPLQQIQHHILQRYPQQALVKFFMPEVPFLRCGSDPLDLIWVFKNKADPKEGTQRHWHYIGFGLSDIHGISNFKEFEGLYPGINVSGDKISGFGIELTFRLGCESDRDWDGEPPKWPVDIMQALAYYVYRSKNILSVGDHQEFTTKSLDGAGDSRIRHILMTFDPTLSTLNTNCGRVEFIQLVGVFDEELQAAREWNPRAILGIMQQRTETGGKFLVTSMRRCESIFELDPQNREVVDLGIAQQGSDMVICTTNHSIHYKEPRWFTMAENRVGDSERHEMKDEEMSYEQDEHISRKGIERGSLNPATRGDYLSNNQSQLISDNRQVPLKKAPSEMSMESLDTLKMESPGFPEIPPKYYESIFLLLSFDAARILPVALKNRLGRCKDFTFKKSSGDLSTTFVPEGSTKKSLVDPERPFARQGVICQLYISHDLRQKMVDALKPDFCDTSNEEEEEQQQRLELRLPKNYSWPEYRLHITVVEEIDS